MHKGFLFLAGALFVPAPALADTLIDNANGIQVDVNGKLQRFAGLLIGDDGKVVRLIAAGETRPAADVVVDAGGRTVLPGLIDAHGHVMGIGSLATQLDLVGTGSLAELKDRLRDYASANSASWIVGRGWNQELWPDKRFPTAADLDSVVGDRPVILERVDGHAVVASTAALKAAGIDEKTPDPSGGRIDRDAAGKPTGLLIDSASALVSAKVPQPSEAEQDEALAKAQQALLSVGITATADMGTEPSGWQTFLRAGELGRLTVRIMSYAFDTDTMRKVVPNGPTPWLYGDRLRMGGVKIYADGALGSRGAWLKKPYADSADTTGLQFLKDAELRAKAESAARRGIQVAIHAIGDSANDQALRIFESLSARYPGYRRWRIEHAQIVDPADIARFAKSRVIASMQPVHQTSDRTMAEKRLGEDRLPGAYAWQSMLKAGARLAFGSDYPVESPNPFHGLSAAISRQDLDGAPPGGWVPSERLSFEQALTAFTRDAAFAGFAEQKIGALDAGKWADFIIVDRDPTKVDSMALGRTKVLETWIGGKKVWKAEPSGSSTPGR